jgi:Helix-turn-helix domain
MSLITMERPHTCSVPEAGRILGIKSRDRAYAAARNGEIPVIRIGRLLRVPLVALERMLDQAAKPPAAA